MKTFCVAIVCSNGHGQVKVRNGAARWSMSAVQNDRGHLTVTGGNEVLVGEREVDPRDVFGGSMGGGGPLTDAYGRSGRTRHTLTCRRCGLHVELLPETTERFIAALVASPDVKWRDVPELPQFVETRQDLRTVIAVTSH